MRGTTTTTTTTATPVVEGGGGARVDEPADVRRQRAEAERWRDRLAWQAGLFGGPDLGVPAERRPLSAARRHDLGLGAWLDVLTGWWPWPDDLFARLVEAADYRLRSMVMYDRVVAQPRLSAGWDVTTLPSSLADLAAAAEQLSRRYGTRFTSVSTNLYRDGDDSVAWHGDRRLRDVDRSVVAVLTLGASRPFRLRPKPGAVLPDGAEPPGARTLHPASGDLVVMGGTCQRTWQHAVPKVARSGPRICVMFRHDLTEDGDPVPV